MRVLIVTDQYAPMTGGVPAVTQALAHGLAGRGHQVLLLAPSPGPRGGPRREARVSVHYRGSVPWPWYAGMRLGLLPALAARALISSFAPDVVHLHSPVTLGVMAGAAARRLGAPVVYTNHYLPVNVRPTAQPPPRVFDAACYAYLVGFSNRCSRVTAPTGTALRLLRERGLRAPAQVISNGIDLRRYAPGPADGRLRARYRLPPGRPLILSVGRLSPEKRADVLLHAAARLSQDALLAVAGGGPDAAALRALAARLALAGRVRFLGHVPGPDLPGLYRLADVFAIASQAELQSLATMEAMASGLPVVAADACALPELVSHGRTGFLARPGDSTGLAAYLDILLADPARRAGMAAAARQAVSRHERGRVLAEWESLYGALAGAGAWS